MGSEVKMYGTAAAAVAGADGCTQDNDTAFNVSDSACLSVNVNGTGNASHSNVSLPEYPTPFDYLHVRTIFIFVYSVVFTACFIGRLS